MTRSPATGSPAFPPPNALLRGMPGESFLTEGLADVQAGRVTVAACLVAMAQTRLQRAGLWPATPMAVPADPELRLYALLRQQEGDAYSRYNGLVRELGSALQALDHRLRRERKANNSLAGHSRPAGEATANCSGPKLPEP